MDGVLDRVQQKTLTAEDKALLQVIDIPTRNAALAKWAQDRGVDKQPIFWAISKLRRKEKNKDYPKGGKPVGLCDRNRMHWTTEGFICVTP